MHWHIGDKIKWSIDFKTKFFIKSLSWSLFSLVLVDNLPSLVCIVCSAINSNGLSFVVFAPCNIKTFLVFNVAEVFVTIDEDLEPSRVGAPDLHVVSSTRTLDIPWLVVQLSLDSLWFLIKVPQLGASSISCLDNHVPVVNEIKIFVRWKLRNNIERSFNIKTEIFAQLSFDWFLFPFILVDDIKQLVHFSMFVMDNDVLVFSVKTTWNIHHFVLFVDDESTISVEHLPPSWVDTRSESEVARSSVTLDF